MKYLGTSKTHAQACPWDIFFSPILSHSIAVHACLILSHACLILSHGIPIEIQFNKS